jgi:hypothetical protein
MDSARWLEYQDVVGLPTVDQRTSLPDFLVISPAKTGSTWLATNLNRHPRILIPPEKEVRYFDVYWRRRLIDWYCSRFTRHSTRLAGDVSPSYALLPSFAIEYIHSIKPNLKIVILLREPAARAWSHLKHTLAFGEANFFANSRALKDVTAEDIVSNLVHDYTLSAGDYEAILRRWLKWFPKEQFHIAFFEDAISTPERYLEGLFAFLGVDVGVRWELVRTPINKSEDASLPSPTTIEWMEAIYSQRRRSLGRFLEQTFQLELPWPDNPLKPSNSDPLRLPCCITGRAVELDDGLFWDVEEKLSGQSSGNMARGERFLGDLLRMHTRQLSPAEASLGDRGVSIEDLRLINVLDRLAEMSLESFHWLGEEQGYNIVRGGDWFYAVDQELGTVDLAAELETLLALHSSERIIVTDTEQAARAHIRAIRSRRPGPFHLIGEEQGYNIVRGGDRFYALDQALGTVDLAAELETLLAQNGSTRIIVTDTEQAARTQVRAIRSRRPGPFHLIGEERGYNIVRSGDKFYAVDQAWHDHALRESHRCGDGGDED